MEVNAQAIDLLSSPTAPRIELSRLSSALKKREKKFTETFRYGQVRLRKRADTGVWYVVYTHPRSGKVMERTLTTTLKKEALSQAEQLSSQLNANKIGTADGTVPIRMLFEEYFRAVKGRNAPETIKRITSSWHMFEVWLENSFPNAKLVKHLTPLIVREFQNYRVTVDEVSKRTADNDICNLHTIFRWGEREKLVAKSPFDYSKNGTVTRYDEPPPAKETYTVEEYLRLLEEAKRVRNFLVVDMIIVFAGTGMRYNELTSLTPNFLCWDAPQPYIDIRAREGFKPKDPKEVKQVPMTPLVAEVLKRRADASNGGYLFRNRLGNKVAENESLGQFKRLFPTAGIKPGRRLYWHSWRNYFIKQCFAMKNSKLTIYEVMGFVGHNEIKIILEYSKATTSGKSRFPEFNQFPCQGKKSL